jgi:serine/threonine-protein kinase
MDKIGAYQILETLRAGPQPLYKAKAVDGRVVALKAVPVASLSAESRERFMREAETCRALQHPNLVPVYDAGEADGMLFQAMELLEGADLGKVIAQGRQFTWDEKISIMEQVCEGLQYAHERHLVHRDVKPANLFLENSGHVRVLDFGMVRLADSELTRAGSSLGTANYMAPEQLRGERCTSASDVFSAGIVFYQLSTGRHPFSRKDRSLGQVISAIVFETPDPLNKLSPDAPDGLDFILNKALEKDPAKRIQNGGDLKQALALCRITMKLGKQAKLEGQKADEPEEPVPAIDENKTRLMERPTGPKPVTKADAGNPTPPDPDIKAANTVPEPRPKPSRLPPTPAPLRYCPACTTPNPPGASICRNCGAPLSGAESAPPIEPPTPWLLYIALAVAAALAIALILVLFKK